MFKSIILLVCAFVAVALAAPAIPTPQQYYMSGTFDIPYFNITEPIELIYDSIGNRQYISYYGGMDITINFFAENNSYSLGPRVNTLICQAVPGNGSLVQVLPSDPSEWIYNGTATVNGQNVLSYTQKVVNYGKEAFYTFYMTAQGVPVQFYLNGVDFIFDSHPDIYVLNFDVFTTDISSYESLFEVPAICDNAVDGTGASVNTLADIFDMGQSLKDKHDGMSAQFDEFKQTYGKSYESDQEHQSRFSTYKQMLNRVVMHNANEAEQKGYTLAMNQFGDMTDAEFKALITPHVERESFNGAQDLHDNDNVADLPATVDWRTSNCVTPVKDQGVCGSCWTFGSTGCLESIACLKHGKLISLSEQQLVDCAYVGPSVGCGGGFAPNAFQYIMDNGGIATESGYPYLMQNGYCKESAVKNSGVQVASYVNVTAFSEAALQNAVATVGPVAIAIDASAPDFRYYSSGVYYSTVCKNGLDDLDHEVLAAGYGTLNGQDYWLVKNSWSTHYGLDGYILMSRNRGNNCGVASQATYVNPV